jgi:murein DD-endopeptidase MepM/ murein hydrolase activator NlpD
MKLADIYAWSIDFYSIHDGDWFKVVYEQQYVKDEPVELGTIRSAVFSHDGEPFYAFYFQSDSAQSGEYYDESGKTLRRFFLKAPLKFSHITSRYTMKRFHPVQKRWKAHLGTDYAAHTGTPIIATGNGAVIESEFSRFNGNYVKIRHNNTYTTQYLHMSRRAVKRGQHVMQGQVIGYVGSTGLATGPHVCYRFWKNNKQVDPLNQKFPSAEPIPQSAIPVFDKYKQGQQQQLETIKVEAVQ